LEIDPQKHLVTFHGDQIRLTPNEFKLLVLLAGSPGRTLTREQLVDDLHGLAPGLDRSVDSHIKNLRKKLEAASGEPLIETVYGVGYRFLEK
jgi:DNA-binding response OmpR family regulator